jgi:hypothetical protein
VRRLAAKLLDNAHTVSQSADVIASTCRVLPMQVRQLEVDTLGPAGVGRLAAKLLPGSKQLDQLSGSAVAALQLENSRLREEVDSLKRRLPALGLLRRTSSNVQLAGAATEQLMAELAQVWDRRGVGLVQHAACVLHNHPVT